MNRHWFGDVAAVGLLAGIACSGTSSTPAGCRDEARPRPRRRARGEHRRRGSPGGSRSRLQPRARRPLPQSSRGAEPAPASPAAESAASRRPVPSPSAAAARRQRLVEPRPTGDILVFAASSLTESFNEIGMAFQAANPGARVTFNFAGSNTLAIQLDQGGQADAFASADTIQMGNAQQSGDLTSDPQIFAHNKLTMVTPSNNPGNVQQVCDLAKPGLKIVAAQATVPVGQYTNDMLDKASTPDQCGEGFRQKVEANIVSREDNVRQLVAKVQLGEAERGRLLPDRRHAAIKPNVQEINIPDDLNTIADYPIATTKGRNMVGGQAFMAYVLSPAGQDILAKWGFIKAQ